MSDDDFWAEMRRKNAHLVGTPLSDEERVKFAAEHGNSFFAKNFPDATSVETALYQADGSILITLTTDDTLGKRTYTQDDKQYVSLFERHQFGEQTEKTHWIALRGDVVIGEGWGSEL